MSRHRLAALASAAAVVTATAAPGVPAAAQPGSGIRASEPVAAVGLSPFAGPELGESRDRKGNLDLRSSETSANPGGAPGMSGSARTQQRIDTLRAQVGPDVRVTVDPVTATPSHLARLDGYLTATSSATPARVVRSYLGNHARALGLSRPDLSTLRLRSSHTDTAGISHVSFEQRVRGLAVFGNGVRGHVDAAGRLISLQGAPVPGLAAAVASQPTAPALPASSVRSDAAADVGGIVDEGATLRSGQSVSSTSWSNGDRADLVWFVTQDGVRLAWSTYTQAGGTLTYTHVIDAFDGRVLYRQDLVDFAEGEARVYDYYPGAQRGGEPQVVSFVDRGWMPAEADSLRGPHVSAWADLDANGSPGDGETALMPERPSDALPSVTSFDDNDLCSASYVCTWDPEQPYSWEDNQQADVANAFYLTNTFREWLERPGIGFTPESGAFDRRGGDPLLLQTLVGADLEDGFPDAEHVDTASMTTPPDGIPATLRTHLWHQPGQPNSIDPYVPMSGSFDASIVFHEYAHGLTNRLVVDPGGNSTLTSFQASAIGEGLSDYYAMDNLVARGLQADSPRRDGQVQLGRYALAGQAPLRTMAIDCGVGTEPVGRCRSSLSDDVGGYTYGDLSDVGDLPTVHSAGEVLSQTLWDIRDELGPAQTRRVVTTAVRLVAPDPSMLDLRDAILQADQVLADAAGRQRQPEALWELFADRGMGWYAGTTSGHDTDPTESFRARPSTERRRSVTGRVTDGETGRGVPDATVAINGQGDAYSATTNGSGAYQLRGVVAGRYQDVSIEVPGYDGTSAPVNVSGRETSLDAALRRNWAFGAAVIGATGRDLSDVGCGPGAALDSSPTTGWSTSTGDDETEEATSEPVPKRVDLELNEAIDIAGGTADGTAFRVDPSHTCGNPASASTDEYQIDVSIDGEQWTTVAEGAFGTTRGRLVPVQAREPVAGVRFVRFWMRSPQVPDLAEQCPEGPYAGCRFMDVSEIQIFGTPARN